MSEPTARLHIERTVAADPATVWRALTVPAQLAQWFSPLAFHIPVSTVEVEARVGGPWRLTMVANDDPAMSSPVDATLSEVVENRLLVGYELSRGFPGVPDGTRMTLSIELVEVPEGTRIIVEQGPFAPEMEPFAAAGWGQSLGKLALLLATPDLFGA